MAEKPDAPIRDIEYLSARQREKLDKWNVTADEYPSVTIHCLFEAEAQRKPDKIAAIYQDTRLSYRELNSRANALAYYLLDRAAIEPNKLVALVVDKSEHMITKWALAGIWAELLDMPVNSSAFTVTSSAWEATA